MKELVFRNENGNPVTNSLLVAEKFEKEHRHVLDSIRNLVAEDSAAKSYFIESEYENRGKMYPMYIMNRDGFTLLAMGFIGTKAMTFKLEYLSAFNKMEAMLNSDEYILMRGRQILEQKLEAQKQQLQILEGQNEHLNNEVKVLAPKAAYTDEVLQSVSTYTMTQVAKEMGMSAIALERKLKDIGIMFRQSGQWMLYAKYAGKGYTKTRTHHYEHSDIHTIQRTLG